MPHGWRRCPFCGTEHSPKEMNREMQSELIAPLHLIRTEKCKCAAEKEDVTNYKKGE